MSASQKFPTRKKRSQSFFGLHFDFHATEKTNRIGSRPFEKSLARLLNRVKPDYVQCDCKGHPGFSSYPTKVGYPAPGIQRDTLKVWRGLTAKQGVSLYMHFSGVWDTQAVKHHPSWGRRDETGKLDGKNTSVFSPYVDKLLLPQLQELRNEYDVDGFWIDGECWATCQDYGVAAQKAFFHETGVSKLPNSPEDSLFFEFTEFCREGFRRYLRYYVDAIHARCPGVEVASNWAFSSFMPEPVTAAVDFLSGDFALIDSVNSARLEARCLMHQGLPWDLMAWAFGSTWGDVHCPTSKSAIQLQREAALVVSLGGGFQMYFQQRADGSIKEHEVPVMESVARFCREREALCHNATSVPQAALLYSSFAYYRKSRRIFSPWDGELSALHGVLNAVLNNQIPADIISEHHLTGNLSRFPLLIIPGWEVLLPAFRRRLLNYVRQGGNLFLVGCGPVRLFQRELGIKIAAKPSTRARWLATGELLAGIHGSGLDIAIRRGTRVLAHWHEANDPSSPSHPAATIRSLGNGRIAALALDFGQAYKEKATNQARDIFRYLLRQLFPSPLIEVSGSHLLDVTLMRKGASLLVHLINTSGEHDNHKHYTHDQIPSLGPLEIRLRRPARPRSVTLQPDGVSLPFTWKNGEAVVHLPGLAVHAILEVCDAF